MNDHQDADNAQASSGNEGIVYVLTNPAMPGLVKIGMTKQSDVTSRMSQLYSTGVPLPFDCEYAVIVKDMTQVERALHIAFEPNRLNPSREFFDLEIGQVTAILDLLKIEDVTPSVDGKANEVIDPADKTASENFKRSRPSLVLGGPNGLDIPDAAEIEFVRDGTKARVVTGEFNRVSYEGKEHSISGLTAFLLGGKRRYVQCGRYWKYNGRLVGDIYNEVHGF